MRPFEIVLIFVNLLSLLWGSKKRSKTGWLGIAGVNLSVFLIHGGFEGLRYQLAFSYVFVVLLVVVAVAKRNEKFYEFKIPNLLKGIAISLCFSFLGLTLLLAYALPVFTLPKPTGSDAVGIHYFHLRDEARFDPFLDELTKKRELMVKVYYPAQEDNSKPFSPYFHNSPELPRLLTTGYGLPTFLFDHLILVKTNSKDDLQLSSRQSSYPVVLFSHGAGTTMEVQTSQSEDLASHGYIVVDIDHTYVSAGTVFPDRIVSAKDATRDFNSADPAEIITQIMADDAEFVIKTLGEMNEGKIESVFAGRLNLDEIGVMGHSVGGAVAYNLAINDSRVKAGIDLDGTVFVAPPADLKQVAPFLMLANDKYHIQMIQNRQTLMKKFAEMDELDQKITLETYGSEQAYKDAYEELSQNIIGLTEVLKEFGSLFTIEGSDHMKFVDVGLFIGLRPLREGIGIGGKTDPVRCLEITKAVTLAFLEQHLKGETHASLESVLKAYPELKRIDLK